MQFTHYARRPFLIEAIKVTKDNIAQLCEDFGLGTMGKTAKGVPFIKVNAKVVPHVYRVYPGFWFTRTETGQIRCYAKRVFGEQYVEYDDAAHFALQPYMREGVVEEQEDGEVIEPEDSLDLATVADANTVPETERVNVFDPPAVEKIQPGATYTPGRINRPPSELDDAHRVTDEVHEVTPTDTEEAPDPEEG